MLHNYFITAFRNLYRNRANTIISVAGLALGITCSMVLFLMATYLRSYNTHHKNYDQIYRLVTESDGQGGERGYTPGVAPPMADALRMEYPLIDEVVFIGNKYGTNLFQVTTGGETRYFDEGGQGIGYTENSFFSVFSRPLLRGNKDKVLSNPNEIVLSEKLAIKFFGDTDPLNQLLLIDRNIELKVVGIMKDYPHTSDFPFDAFISYSTIKAQHLLRGWGSVDSDDQVFLYIKDPQLTTRLASLFPEFVTKYKGEDNGNMELYLQPMSDLHFNINYSTFSYDVISDLEIAVMWVIGIFLLITASINYINLSTAVAIKRSKEVGIRKVLGSTRLQLIKQHLGETFIVTLISLLISLGLAELAVIELNDFLDVHIRIELLHNTALQLYIVTILLTVTILSGFYPSIVLSGYSPVFAMKNSIAHHSNSRISLRKPLVVFQFLISQLFIIGTFVIIWQLDFILSTDLGFKTKGVMEVPLPDEESARKLTLLNELKRIAGVEGVSLTYSTPTSNSTSVTNAYISDDPEDYIVEVKKSDAQYTNVFDIKVIAGKGLIASDTINGALVNKEFTKLTAHQTPDDIIGKTLTISGKKVPIVGVVEDFHTRSLQQKKSPVVIYSHLDSYLLAAIAINTKNLTATTEHIKKVWKVIYPEYSYEQTFMDSRIAEFYEDEQQVATILTTFSSIAILIGCMGLFGLASFMANQKVKEVGIRKVLGASVMQILILFSKEFILLIGFAFIIAAPLAYFFMSRYLEMYEYRIDLGPGVFLIALVSSILIAVLTVGGKSFKAATANPVRSLKDE